MRRPERLLRWGRHGQAGCGRSGWPATIVSGRAPVARVDVPGRRILSDEPGAECERRGRDGGESRTCPRWVTRVPAKSGTTSAAVGRSNSSWARATCSGAWLAQNAGEASVIWRSPQVAIRGDAAARTVRVGDGSSLPAGRSSSERPAWQSPPLASQPPAHAARPSARHSTHPRLGGRTARLPSAETSTRRVPWRRSLLRLARRLRPT